MIREVNRACKKLNKALGVSLSLPSPGKRELKKAAVCNLAAGAALAAAGVLLSSKWCVLLGGVEIAGSIALQREGIEKES